MGKAQSNDYWEKLFPTEYIYKEARKLRLLRKKKFEKRRFKQPKKSQELPPTIIPDYSMLDLCRPEDRRSYFFHKLHYICRRGPKNG